MSFFPEHSQRSTLMTQKYWFIAFVHFSPKEQRAWFAPYFLIYQPSTQSRLKRIITAELDFEILWLIFVLISVPASLKGQRILSSLWLIIKLSLKLLLRKIERTLNSFNKREKKSIFNWLLKYLIKHRTDATNRILYITSCSPVNFISLRNSVQSKFLIFCRIFFHIS